jgi:hypothetical protein
MITSIIAEQKTYILDAMGRGDYVTALIYLRIVRSLWESNNMLAEWLAMREKCAKEIIAKEQ